MPLYTFQCRIKGHEYEGIRPLTHSGVEGCEGCAAEGLGFAFAHRIMSSTSVHIPGRATLRKLHDETVEFANRQTKIAESKARKVQPLR